MGTIDEVMNLSSSIWWSLFGPPLKRRSYIADPPAEYVVIDLETTGLDPEACEIIQVAAVRYRNFAEVGAYHTKVKPSAPIPMSATQINGITNDAVRLAPSIGKIKQPLSDFVGNSIVMGYNFWRFDRNFLIAAFGHEYVQSWPVIDVLACAFETLEKQKSYKLTDLSSAIGYHGTSHDALSDCRATSKLFEYMCRPSQELRKYYLYRRHR